MRGNGRWKGEQVLSRDWVAKTTAADMDDQVRDDRL